MQPYDVKLSHKEGSLGTVELELGPDEVGDTKDAVPVLNPELIDLLAVWGYRVWTRLPSWQLITRSRRSCTPAAPRGATVPTTWSISNC